MQPLEACRFGFGTLANIMSPAQEQFIRLRRFLARMEKRGATDDDTDDLYSFFMHAWHLIDWASNDQSIARTYSQIVGEIPDSIKRCQDIANRAKHLVLNRPLRPTPTILRRLRMFAGRDRPNEASFSITFPDRTTRDALDLARQVVEDWRTLLVRYGVSV